MGAQLPPIQGASGEFAGILYPNCLAPVEFIAYRQVDASAAFRRV